MSITDKLRTLVETITDLGVPINSVLQPGVDRSYIDRMCTGIGIQPIPDYIDLYTWHNGSQVGRNHFPLFADHTFISLEAAIGYRNNLLLYPFKVLRDVLVFTRENGAYLGVYCKPDLICGLQHPVFEIDMDVCIRYENMSAMLDTCIDIHRHNLIYGSDENFDDDLYEELLRKHNPNIPETYEFEVVEGW